MNFLDKIDNFLNRITGRKTKKVDVASVIKKELIKPRSRPLDNLPTYGAGGGGDSAGGNNSYRDLSSFNITSEPIYTPVDFPVDDHKHQGSHANYHSHNSNSHDHGSSGSSSWSDSSSSGSSGSSSYDSSSNSSSSDSCGSSDSGSGSCGGGGCD